MAPLPSRRLIHSKASALSCFLFLACISAKTAAVSSAAEWIPATCALYSLQGGFTVLISTRIPEDHGVCLRDSHPARPQPRETPNAEAISIANNDGLEKRAAEFARWVRDRHALDPPAHISFPNRLFSVRGHAPREEHLVQEALGEAGWRKAYQSEEASLLWLQPAVLNDSIYRQIMPFPENERVLRLIGDRRQERHGGEHCCFQSDIHERVAAGISAKGSSRFSRDASAD
mmetsp:Transcript_48213/g.120692  ORF Transcript_48213/g.120692 Transcript_48213/m.120692 type:complete len:231 (+) Transcript_48213:58-750(+)